MERDSGGGAAATSRGSTAAAATAILASLSLCGVFVWFVLFDRAALGGAVTNSDSMILPQIHWNMLQRSGGWFTQQQPRLLGLFPDQIVHHTLLHLLGDFRLAFPSLVTVLLFADAMAAAAILRQATPVSWVAATTVSTLVFVGACLLTLDWRMHAEMVGLINHSGGFTLSLAVALLTRRSPRDPLLLSLVAVGCLSDSLILAQAVVPWIAARLVVAPPQRWTRHALSPFAPVAVAAVVGIAAQALVFHQSNKAPPLTAIPTFLRDLASDFRPATAVAIALLAMAVAGWRVWRRGGGGDTDRAVHAFALVAMGSSLAAMIVFWVDYGALRYAWPAVGWPLILVAREVAMRVSAPTILGGWAVAGVVAVTQVAADGGRPQFLSWRDPEEVCVSRVVADEGLNAGLAGYWHARRLVVSSDFALKIEQVNDRGVARLWGNDPYWFLHDHRRADGGVRYDFVLIADLDRAAITAAYGSPDAVRSCPRTEVWIWRDPDRILPILVERSAETLSRIVRPDRR